MGTETRIRPATTADLEYCVHLHRQFAHALGFIPRAGLLNAISADHVTMADENDAPAGYLLHRRLNGEKHIHSIVQAAVAMDAQRRHHGLAALVDLERSAGTDLLQCWCAEDLEANAFWHAAGFLAVGMRNPENVRGRNLILWRKPLTPMGIMRLTDRPKRAGPKAARPKNMIIFDDAERARLQIEPPAVAVRSLQQLGKELPRTTARINLAELLRVYHQAAADPSLAVLANEIRAAVLNGPGPDPTRETVAPRLPEHASPPATPPPAAPSTTPRATLAARARAAALARQGA